MHEKWGRMGGGWRQSPVAVRPQGERVDRSGAGVLVYIIRCLRLKEELKLD